MEWKAFIYKVHCWIKGKKKKIGTMLKYYYYYFLLWIWNCLQFISYMSIHSVSRCPYIVLRRIFRLGIQFKLQNLSRGSFKNQIRMWRKIIQSFQNIFYMRAMHTVCFLIELLEFNSLELKFGWKMMKKISKYLN